MTSILDRISNGEDPKELGRRGGIMANRILDWVWLGGGKVYCKTPRRGWHTATEREKEKLFGNRRR